MEPRIPQLKTFFTRDLTEISKERMVSEFFLSYPIIIIICLDIVGTVYGQGVYFSTDAYCASAYTSADPEGYK